MDRPPTPTLLYQWSEILRCQKCDLSPKSAACECHWNRTWFRKAHCNASAASALVTRTEAADTHPDPSRLRAHSGGCFTPREQHQCNGCGGNHMANYRGCVKWKEAKAAPENQAPDRGRKCAPIGHPAAPEAQRAGPPAEQMYLGEG